MKGTIVAQQSEGGVLESVDLIHVNDSRLAIEEYCDMMNIPLVGKLDYRRLHNWFDEGGHKFVVIELQDLEKRVDKWDR